MRLSDIMSAADLAVFPKIALALFLAAFAGILWRTYVSGRRDEFQRWAHLPVDQDLPAGDDCERRGAP